MRVHNGQKPHVGIYKECLPGKASVAEMKVHSKMKYEIRHKSRDWIFVGPCRPAEESWYLS